ncbi:hypothetical protein V8F20_004635 [Naviculisporaceae sp. PSN 640]
MFLESAPVFLTILTIVKSALEKKTVQNDVGWLDSLGLFNVCSTVENGVLFSFLFSIDPTRVRSQGHSFPTELRQERTLSLGPAHLGDVCLVLLQTLFLSGSRLAGFHRRACELHRLSRATRAPFISEWRKVHSSFQLPTTPACAV